MSVDNERVPHCWREGSGSRPDVRTRIISMPRVLKHAEAATQCRRRRRRRPTARLPRARADEDEVDDCAAMRTACRRSSTGKPGAGTLRAFWAVTPEPQ